MRRNYWRSLRNWHDQNIHHPHQHHQQKNDLITLTLSPFLLRLLQTRSMSVKRKQCTSNLPPVPSLIWDDHDNYDDYDHDYYDDHDDQNHDDYDENL